MEASYLQNMPGQELNVIYVWRVAISRKETYFGRGTRSATQRLSYRGPDKQCQ